MKKAVKALITASAVAAVVGVGAVSYAAWSAGSVADKTVTGNTGSINTIGSLSVSPDSGLSALYPVDQGGSYTTYWTFTVTVEGNGDQTVTLKGEYEAGSSGKAIGDGVIYYSTQQPNGAAPSSKQDIATAQEITLSSGSATIYVFFTNGEGATNYDMMGGQIKLTFSASATNA
ncbi:MAG: hypothetical protein J1F71_00470 [Clostridiales bacterium]|nr:hypothetical protein [Clostridiales bacterium]